MYLIMNHVKMLELKMSTNCFLLCCFITLIVCCADISINETTGDIQSADITLIFDPPDGIRMYEEQEVNITFSIVAKENYTWTDNYRNDGMSQCGCLTVLPEPSFRLAVKQDNHFNVNLDDLVSGFNRTLRLKGLSLGHAKLRFYWKLCSSQELTTEYRPYNNWTSSSTVPSEHEESSLTLSTRISEKLFSVDGLHSDVNIEGITNSFVFEDSVHNDSRNQIVNDDDGRRFTPTENIIEAKEHFSENVKDIFRFGVLRFIESRFARSVDQQVPEEQFSHSDGVERQSTVLNEKKVLIATYKASILRSQGVLDTILLIFVGIFVVINTTLMGCQVDLAVVWAVLKRPVGPVVGLLSQFAFMPLASYGMGYALLKESNLRLGLFALGCSPGGNSSNFWTLLLHGDLNLSVTMTFISTLSAMFMMPMWLYTLGQTILSEGNISIPFLNLFTSLVSFCIPVAIGVTIRYYRPHWAKIAKKIIRPFSVLIIITFSVIGSITSLFIFKLMTWRILLAALCVSWGGFFFGFVMAWLFRVSKPQIIAISLETAIQNGGIAFMVMKLTLQQPDADLSSVAPISQLMLTGQTLILLYVILITYRKVKQCCFKSRRSLATTDAGRSDIDAIEPLMINRSSVLPHAASATDDEKLQKKAGAIGNTMEMLQPATDQQNDNKHLYASMYTEHDDDYYEAMYAKQKLQLKISTDSCHYVNNVPNLQLQTFEDVDGTRTQQSVD